MRKQRLPPAGQLPFVSLRQGGQPAVRAAGLRTPDETRSSRLVRRLPGTRYPDGDDAQRRGGHGRRASAHRRERDVPPTTNVGALSCRRNHEARASHHPPKQSGLD